MRFSTPSFWYRDTSKAPPLVETALMPLSFAYELASKLHRFITQPAPYKSTAKVICIGNLTAGGSGKTPTAIAVFKLIQEQQLAQVPHFLTRGYGGTLSGPVLVDLEHHSAEEVGDEALLLARTGPTIVSRNRMQGAIFAEGHGADMLIMDDGLQNNTLEKDINLVVIDGKMGWGNGKVLPAGPLREPLKRGIERADGFILLGEDCRDITQQLPSNASTLRGTLKTMSTPQKDKTYFAFTGLGYPDKFFQFLKEDCGLNIVETRPFPDHHPYSDEDVETLLTDAKAANATLITTEKDRVRLPADMEVDALPVEIKFDQADALLALIKNTAVS